MSDYTTDQAIDTWANEAKPSNPYSTTNAVWVRNTPGGQRHGFVKPTLDGPSLAGRTVLLAELTGHVQTPGPAQSVTVKDTTERWEGWRIDWDHRPAVGSGTIPVAVAGGLVDGDTVTWDVTTLIQAVADGAEWSGFRLHTDNATGMSFVSADDGDPAWTLEVSLSESPEQPSDLRPDGGAVGTEAPVLAWDSDGDGTIPQAEFRVIVYPSEVSGTPVHDSGWVVSPDPEYDLAASAYVPTATPYWTVQTKSSTGVLSEVSDRAWWTYAAKPTLVVDTPTGGVIGDPTPPVAAHLSSGTLQQWRAKVTSGNRSDVRYDSGVQSGALSFTIPRRHEGQTVLRDEQPAWLHLRAWDAVDRVAAVGDPTYTEQWVALTWDDAVGVTAPTGLTVTPVADGDARHTWQWSCTVQPEGAWLLQADGATVLRVDAADITPVAGVYTYTDQGQVPPMREVDLKVRATDAAGNRSTASTVAAHSHVVEGVWLVPFDGSEAVVLSGTDVDGVTREDHYARYPMQDGTVVDIIYGRPGLTGTLPLGVEGPDAFTMLDRFDALTPDATAIPRVQLVWGSRSIRVRLISPHHVPDPDMLPNNKLHQVRFSFVQDD